MPLRHSLHRCIALTGANTCLIVAMVQTAVVYFDPADPSCSSRVFLDQVSSSRRLRRWVEVLPPALRLLLLTLITSQSYSPPHLLTSLIVRLRKGRLFHLMSLSLLLTASALHLRASMGRRQYGRPKGRPTTKRTTVSQTGEGTSKPPTQAKAARARPKAKPAP